jgi:hypothetical protein
MKPKTISKQIYIYITVSLVVLAIAMTAVVVQRQNQGGFSNPLANLDIKFNSSEAAKPTSQQITELQRAVAAIDPNSNIVTKAILKDIDDNSLNASPLAKPLLTEARKSVVTAQQYIADAGQALVPDSRGEVKLPVAQAKLSAARAKLNVARNNIVRAKISAGATTSVSGKINAVVKVISTVEAQIYEVRKGPVGIKDPQTGMINIGGGDLADCSSLLNFIEQIEGTQRFFDLLGSLTDKERQTLSQSLGGTATSLNPDNPAFNQQYQFLSYYGGERLQQYKAILQSQCPKEYKEYNEHKERLGTNPPVLQMLRIFDKVK